MSVWKRLANIAKGQVKVWQRGDPPKDAVLDAEIQATARANAAAAERRQTEAEGAARRWARDDAPKGGVRRDPAEDPVERTDLLPPAPDDSDPAQPDDAVQAAKPTAAPEPVEADAAKPEPVQADAAKPTAELEPVEADAEPSEPAPLDEEADSVLEAVSGVLGAVPSPFEPDPAPAERGSWDLLPADEPDLDDDPVEGGDIVEADEVDRKL